MEKEELNEIEEINEKTSAPSCWMMGIFFLGLKRKAHHPRGATLVSKNKNTPVGAGPVSAQNAITLISLVITIIILLILAAVAINLTIGENGIFGLAQNAGKNYMDAQERELAEIDNLYSYIDNAKLPENTPETDAGTVVKMPENWYSEISAFYEAPEGKQIKTAQKIASVYGVSDGQGNTIPIPKEFYYVGGDIKTGIVISDNEADRNKYAGKNEDGTVKEVEKDLAGNQFVWIPCEEKDYHKINWGLDNCRWELETRFSRNITNTKIWRILYRKIRSRSVNIR